MNDKIFNDLFVFDHEKGEMQKVEYLEDGLIVPKRRNSHCFVQVEGKVYIYGGANDEGPLNDSFELDLETSKFKRIRIQNPN